MAFTRVIKNSMSYGAWGLQGNAATETGDTEVLVQETVGIGATVVFPMAIIAANLQALAVQCVPATASVITNATDTILPIGGAGVSVWALSHGLATPLPLGDTTSITVNNSGGATAVTVFVAALIETP